MDSDTWNFLGGKAESTSEWPTDVGWPCGSSVEGAAVSLDISERERVEACVLALLAMAGSMELEITRTKLAKLLYFADISSVECDGITGSGVAWHYMEHGPYDDVLREVEDDLVKRGLVHKNTGPRPEGGERNVLTVKDLSITVPDDFSGHVQTVLDEMGDWKSAELKDRAYSTQPMAAASRDDLLDFTTVGHLTLADIDASISKVPYDPSDCTFHASTEDFIAALEKR